MVMVTVTPPQTLGVNTMPLTYTYCALVHPASSTRAGTQLNQVAATQTGQLLDLLLDIFYRAESECDMDLVFKPDMHRAQNNECRNALMAFVRNPSVHTGEIIARRLETVTPPQAGVALLFLLLGTDNKGQHRLVVSRFSAETGILAQEVGQSLSLKFIEQIFLKNAFAYKSAFFKTEDIAADFPGGRTMDRQARNTGKPAKYWVQEFLQSELLTTDASGTQFLAKALDEAVKSEKDGRLKQELLSATTLIRGFDGFTQSTESMLTTLPLTEPAVQAITARFSRPESMRDVFRFNAAEYDKHIRYQTVELDNGATLTAVNGDFSEVFQEEIVSDDGRVRFTTEGNILDRRIRRVK